MGGIFKEKEKEHISLLPQIELVEKLYHPIVSLSRSAKNLLIQPEATYQSTMEADHAVNVSKNVSDLKLEVAPLPSRFSKMLESI